MLLCCTADTSNFFTEKVLPPVITSATVILLFVVGRLLDGKYRAREARRNWYLKVIIEPNIDKVNSFYQEVMLYVLASMDNLHQQILELKSKEIGKFQTLKRTFEHEVIYLVKSNFPETSERLTELLRDFEDDITGLIDTEESILTADKKIETVVFTSKHDLFKALYEPLRFKRMRLRDIFKRKVD
jgi:hypothetical protein